MSDTALAEVIIGHSGVGRHRPICRLLFDAFRYYLVFVLFAFGMALFLAGLLAFTAASSRERRGRATRRAIHVGARLFFVIVEGIGMLKVRCTEAKVAPCDEPAIFVANHPSMLDAFLLLSRIPQGVCIMKGSLIRMPLISAFAKMAGYIWQRTPEQVIRHAAGRLAEGASIIVFPEGTRSPAVGFGEIKRGAPRLAVETRAPLVVFRIRMEPLVLGRGQRWWVPPVFPVRYELERLGTLEAPLEPSPPGDQLSPMEMRKRVFWMTKQLEVTLRNSL